MKCNWNHSFLTFSIKNHYTSDLNESLFCQEHPVELCCGEPALWVHPGHVGPAGSRPGRDPERGTFTH